jgi:O-antigen/teichoic acid export membrane protein
VSTTSPFAALGRVRLRMHGSAHRFAPAGGLRRAVALLAGGNVLAVAIVALSYPIVSRLYDPTEFGAYAAAMSLLNLILSVTCLTYDHAIPLPKDDETASDLVVLSLIGAVLMTSISTVLMLTLGGKILGLFDAESLAPYWWLLAGAQLVGGVVVALTGWAVRFRDFRGLATSRISQSIFTAGAQVLGGVAGAGSPGLLTGDVLGRTSAGGRLSLGSTKRLSRSARNTSRARLTWTARRYKRFPLIGSWPTLVNAIGFEAPLLLIVAFYGATTGGLFAFAQRLIGAPVALLVLAVSQVFVAEAADRARAKPEELVALFRRTLRRLAFICIPLMALLAVVSEILVGIVFGSEWHEAGVYIVILSPLYAAQMLSSPLGGTLDVLERQDLLFIREVARIALLTMAIGVAVLLGLSALWAVILLSAAGTLAYVFYGGISWHALITFDKKLRAADAEP